MQSAPISDVRYSVRFDRSLALRRSLEVTMTFATTGGAREPVLLSLPAWTPGAYELNWFSRKVSSFRATAGGNALRWDKADFDTWRVMPDGARSVAVTFTYTADELDNAEAWSQPDFTFFNGTNVFPYAEGRGTDFAATVSVVTDSTWRVATGMASGAAPRTYTAPNYHDLVDMPFFVGRIEVDSAQIAGKWVRLATYPMGVLAGTARQDLWDQMRKMFPPMIKVFGDTPYDAYTNLLVFDSTYGGGSALEHQNSHVGIYNPAFIGDPVLPSITAHEIFHLWNVKRLRPADLVPYQYDRAQPTTWLWVSEGITDYYADLALVRGGIVDSSFFLRLTSNKMGEVANAPPVALEDASLSIWVHPTDGTDAIYYPKGSLAGLLLDIMIRDASDNQRSLDDVMSELYRTTFKAGRGFAAQEWWAAVSRAAGGKSFADVNARYIDGREPFPWTTVLPLAGMRVHTDSIRSPQLGISTFGDSSGIRVVDVDPGSAAAEAGIRPDDYLLRIGDLEVTDAAFGGRFRARFSRADGEQVPVIVRRGNEQHTLTLRIRVLTRTQDSVQFDRSASPKAMRIRKGILTGTTGS
jgi:predicted metalloprotease with PDZ domain